MMALQRRQRTIIRPTEVQGIGFFTGADVRVRFLPARANQGVLFQRVDAPLAPPIPAVAASTVPRERRTAVERQGITIEMTEHVLAALSGLRIDNCLVELDATELPGLDGSSQAYVDALLAAGIAELDAVREQYIVTEPITVRSPDGKQSIICRPATAGGLTIEYQLDYGPASPISPQSACATITPDTFVRELAFARTFVLEQEVQWLRSQGYGRRTTARDLLIFGSSGVIENALRAENECARHKALDCVGDFAMLGCDLVADITASRSGHRLNLELVRALLAAQERAMTSPRISKAA